MRPDMRPDVGAPFIMVAPTGARRTRADHPALPVTIPEIVQTAAACHTAGADALHLHVRDTNGAHTLDAGLYLEALGDLAAAVPDMPVQITTEAAGLFDVAAQLACLRAVKPAWASISVREIQRAPDMAHKVYGTCADAGTRVQHILYDTADLALLADWHARGIVQPDQTDLLFVLGRYTTGQTATPDDLSPFLDAAPAQARWMLCAFGHHEHACLHAAAQRGGALRVGFENNLNDDAGHRFADNAASVKALRRRLAQGEHPPAEHAPARQPPKP